mmetsp:Transcript_129258/g.288998  ORF Transcript_129258/g.288998 Transcript_129258/m.288998 type:complete len:965 (-) Transcript_129258:64-2958(-)
MAILEATFNIICGAETEIAIFLIAIIAHALLFGKYRIINKHIPVKAHRSPRPAHDNTQKGGKTATEQTRSLRSTTAYPLVRALRPLLQEGADEDQLLAVCLRETASLAPEAVTDAFAFVLETYGKSPANSSLLAAVRKAMVQRELPTTSHLSELLLRGYLFSRLMDDFNKVLAEADAAKVRNPGIATLELRAALITSNLEAAMGCVKALAPQWRLTNNTASSAPQGMIQQLTRLCAGKGALKALLEELRNCEALTPTFLECALFEYLQRDDAEGLAWAEELATEGGVELTRASLCALVRGADITAAGKGIECSDAVVLRRFDHRTDGMDFLADVAAGRRIADAAFRRGRKDVLPILMAASPEGPHQVALLKSFVIDKRLSDAFVVFEASSEKTTCLYNALLDACIDCGDLKAAERAMGDAAAMKLADVVTYNTIIKAHLQSGDLKRARAAMDTMRLSGLQPNCVTFNEFIDTAVKTNSDEAWTILAEMKACGLQPNQVTCSILLKSIQKWSRPVDVERTLAVVDSVAEQMDEVLLSAACEACIRAGRSDLIVKQLSKRRTGKGVQVTGAHTFGSIIRAYGFIEDLAGVLDTWREMKERRIALTSITLGCMVEAVVNLDDPEAGHQMIREIMNEPETRPLVNAVIYCSVLKGFSHRKRFDRVWTVYEEMLSEKLQFSIVTYNALIDACARSCDMGRVQNLLQEMASQDIEPNMITYSTIVKGYCQDNRLDEAFELLDNMKKTANLLPDEITYNTLLDGCARNGLFDRGIGILEEMQADGVTPSNFTLSVLAKLCTRGKRPEKAFVLCEEISRKYNFKMNVHVYNNLVVASTGQRDMRGALDTLELMLREGVRPDARTYMVLLRGGIQAGCAQDTAGLLCAAVGMRDIHPRLARFGASFCQPRGGISEELISETLTGLACYCGAEKLAMQLLKELKQVPGMRLNPKLQLQLTSKAIQAPSAGNQRW